MSTNFLRTSLRSRIKYPSKLVSKHSSDYHQKMRALSCKIFNKFYIPELPKKQLDYGTGNPSVQQWINKWYLDFRTFERNMDLPLDIDDDRNMNYYPAHPQIRELTHILREYGLFRDEHRDFNEEMKDIALSRGKTFRKRGGNKK